MTALTPPDPWLAGFVTRWHAGTSAPWLARTGDTVAGHSGRMAALALWLWPDASRDLLAACILHDLGEYREGDLPWSTTRANTDLAEAQAREDMGLPEISMDVTDSNRLNFLDRLDAYLWAQHHAPEIMSRDDWATAHLRLQTMAGDLGATLDQPPA